MIKGLMVIQVPEGGPWKVLGQFIPAAEEKPEEEIINAIISRFSGNTTTAVNYRRFPYKFFCFTIPQEGGPLTIGIYVLENGDTLDLVKIFLNETQTFILEGLKTPKNLPGVLKSIMDNRNHIIEKLEKPKILESEIGAAANKLIENKQYDLAQERIKLARDIPAEIFSANKKAGEFLKIGDYRRAERSLLDAKESAAKIGDKELEEYFNHRIETVRNIPLNEKELKTQFAAIVKNLQKSPSNLAYLEQVPKLRRSLELLDLLENDDKMQQIQDLDGLLQEAQTLVNKLNEIDRQVKTFLNYMN
jgi:hypothetical protein